jgi:hypothetical protein
MLRFREYLLESDASASNSALGDAYESATVLHIHNNTAAKDNTDSNYVKHIEAVKQKHAEAMAKLPAEKQKKVLAGAKASAESYLKSLSTNHGMKSEDIHEVHHTNFGIDSHVGKSVDRAMNPHDLIVKGKNGFTHGASLKLTAGTASNNTAKSLDEKGGLNTNLSKIWNEGKARAGLAGLPTKEVKARKREPKVVAVNNETQQAAAQHHADVFNNADHSTQKEHIRYLLKARPNLDYDYVKGEKGGSSTPVQKLPQIQNLNNSRSLRATVRNNVVHIHDQDGNHIAYVEHRPTHGAFSSIQANAKFGTVKK